MRLVKYLILLIGIPVYIAANRFQANAMRHLIQILPITDTVKKLNTKQPLYVIDGMTIAGKNVHHNDSTLTISEGKHILRVIKTADIQSVHVLKDIEAMPIYGARAANGVILITTKKR
jgi:TonB-dependent starch-binding outer membrane protein SusC